MKIDPTPGCTCQCCTDKRRDAKRRQVLLDTGRPSLMSTEDRERVVKHVKGLYRNGMTNRQIAYSAGAPELVHTVADLTGDRKPGARIRRSTYDTLMKARPMPVDGVGSKVSSIGARRRVRALHAAGYPLTWIAAELECTNAYLHSFERGHKAPQRMYASTALRIATVYDKLSLTRAEDHGVAGFSARRARAHARSMGFPPPGAWDADTIDNPDAEPEWTGACGTPAGYRIHKRDDIPACGRCIAAFAEDRRAKERNNP